MLKETLTQRHRRLLSAHPQSQKARMRGLFEKGEMLRLPPTEFLMMSDDRLLALSGDSAEMRVDYIDTLRFNEDPTESPTVRVFTKDALLSNLRFFDTHVYIDAHGSEQIHGRRYAVVDRIPLASPADADLWIRGADALIGWHMFRRSHDGADHDYHRAWTPRTDESVPEHVPGAYQVAARIDNDTVTHRAMYSMLYHRFLADEKTVEYLRIDVQSYPTGNLDAFEHITHLLNIGQYADLDVVISIGYDINPDAISFYI